MKTTQKYSVIF